MSHVFTIKFRKNGFIESSNITVPQGTLDPWYSVVLEATIDTHIKTHEIISITINNEGF